MMVSNTHLKSLLISPMKKLVLVHNTHYTTNDVYRSAAHSKMSGNEDFEDLYITNLGQNSGYFRFISLNHLGWKIELQ